MDNQDMREFGWDDTIEHDSTYTLVPEGDYQFTVKSFERGRHQGSEKLPPCNMAILQLEVTDGRNTGLITRRLFLHSKTEGMLCEFFTAIGQRKHGEPLKMNWASVTGAKGRCKIAIEPYKGTDYNDVKKFYEYDPAKMTTPTAPPRSAYAAGQF